MDPQSLSSICEAEESARRVWDKTYEEKRRDNFRSLPESEKEVVRAKARERVRKCRANKNPADLVKVREKDRIRKNAARKRAKMKTSRTTTSTPEAKSGYLTGLVSSLVGRGGATKPDGKYTVLVIVFVFPVQFSSTK